MMVGTVVAFCVVTVLLGERIGVNQGQGWDGMGYTSWAQDFSRHVLTEGVTHYYSQRLLPSGIVGVGLHATGAAPTVPNVILGFQILDSLALIAAAVIWTRIAAALQWRRLATWVGFGGLFLSFACARHALFYPTLTDSSALLLGMLMTWGYVANHASALWVTAAVGMFTWPAIVPHAVLMLLVPRAREPVPSGELSASRARWLGIGCGVLAAIGYTLLSLHYYRSPLPAVGFDKFVKWIRSDLLILTIPLTAALLGIGTYVVFSQRSTWNVKHVWRDQKWQRRALVIVGVAGLLVVRGWWIHRVGTRGDGPTLSEFVCQQALEALRGPLWGPVHHVVYFGPIIVVALLAWRRISTTAAAWGPAATVTLAVLLAFAPSSESRQWIHLFPFLVAVTVTGTQERWTPRAAIVFLACALAWSKLWLHIGYDAPGNWLVFPTQKYFMHLGPWASDTMYLVHFGALAVTLVLFYFLIPREPIRE
jgi:hypothetical protein